jgi:formylglycine-generating enzyme required for sulfatase activity
VKVPSFIPPVGAVGRADLLRMLALTPCEYLTLDADGESWFGYIKRPQLPSEHDSIHLQLPALTGKASASEPGYYKLPLRMPFIHVIAERSLRQPPKGDERIPSAEIQAEPIDEDDAKAPSGKRLVGYQDLVPQARLLPALRRQLTAARVGSLDLNRLIHDLANWKLPRHLPLRRLQRWHPELVVVLDFCQRLWPYREDMHRLAERLLQQCGRSGVSLRIVNHGPFGPWSDWLAHQNRQAKNEPSEYTWKMPPIDTPVLIVSDLGLLQGAQSSLGRMWQAFIVALVKAQLRPVALIPLGARQLDGALPPSLTILRWSPDARARPERPRGSGQPAPEGLDDLLAMAAVTRRVDPPLLRALRRINPRSPLNAGLEGALWCHADVEAGITASIRSEVQERHLHRFSERLKDLHTVLESLRCAHHAHLRAVLNHEESLLWRAHASVSDNDLSPETRQRMADADAFFAKLVATLEQPDSLKSAGIWWNVAQGIIQRADVALGEHHLMRLAAVLANRGMPLPGWADPAQLAGLLRDERGAIPCWLVRDTATGCLLLQSEPAGVRQSPVGEPFLLDAGGARLRIGEGSKAYRRWLSIRDLPAELVLLSEPVPVYIDTARETITVAAVRRPRGIMDWSCHASGITVRAPELGGFYMQWSMEVGDRRFEQKERETGPTDSFDVFLTYGVEDITLAKSLAHALESRGLRVWLDDLLVPGERWVEAVKTVLQRSHAVAVLIGTDKRFPWQDIRWNELIKRNQPVIPVLLPGSSPQPDLPLLLQNFSWVDLRVGLTDEGIGKLVEGITGGKPRRMSAAMLRAARSPDGLTWTLEADAVTVMLGNTQLQFGLDRTFGVYADFTISTSYGTATQRLRWIEPGSFLMGSPEDELERDSDEGPRHLVTLTHGFWLADSACTQALWQAVMGDNPSHFKGDDQRPVEQVSWYDAQAFLRKLEALLPGCRADLPTEAEWEYACRAGTDTPFSFGVQITPDLVNYGGNYPYAGGEQGLFRQATVPVKSLPANAWGLYEMHGNVWEWCADGTRTYDGEPQQDPVGPEGEEAHRAIRGGSWLVLAGWVRSAYRRADRPGSVGPDQGFRLCLRSIEPGQVPGRPGGTADLATGGSRALLFERIDDLRSKAVTMGKIADILQVRGQLDEALRIRREEELPVYERLGDVRSLLVGRTNLAILLLQKDAASNAEHARELLFTALRDARQLNIPEAGQIETILRQLGWEGEG